MKRATITDVANLAGVSRSAVSKVIRDAYGVSDEMRQGVEKAMQALNSRPQTAARGLRGSTFTLGVVLPDIRHPFFPDVLDGVRNALQETPYQSLLAIRPPNDSEKPLIETMRDRKLDGLILIAPIIELSYARTLAMAIPTVILGGHKSHCGFDTVNNDDELGARTVVEHFIKQGHQKITYFGTRTQESAVSSPDVFRLKAYLDTMREHGLAHCISVRDGSDGAAPELDRSVALDLLRAKNRPSAVFAWTDNLAITLMSVAHEIGLRIPEDIAVAGYDNSKFCEVAQISLTSIDQDAHQLGAKAAELLLQRIAGRTDEIHFVTPPTLIIRRSSEAPPAH